MPHKLFTNLFFLCLLASPLLLIPTVLGSEDIPASDAECAAEGEEECSAMLQVQKNRTQTALEPVLPPKTVAYGAMITSSQWSSMYDFVVGITVFQPGGAFGCTGTVWGDKVITAAHCGTSSDTFKVKTALFDVDVIKAERHPNYPAGGGPYDFMLLTLAHPFKNTAPVALKSSENADGLEIMIAGMGVTAESDSNPLWPSAPVVSNYQQKITCPSYWDYADCTGSGPSSKQASCGADSGGPWLYFQGVKAVIAGANAFGYDGACGDASKMTGFMPMWRAKEWLDQVAPNHFIWTN